MKINRRIVGAVMVLGLVMTACGSDDDSSDAEVPSTDAPASESSGDTNEESASSVDTFSPAQDLEVVKLGQVLPFESVLAGLTVPEGFGAEVGIAHANADGIEGGYEFELVQKDDQLDEARMNTVMRELSDDGVNFTFGFQITSECRSAAAAAAEDQIVLASHCASASLTDGESIAPNFWRLSATDAILTKAMGQALAAKYPQIEHWDVVGYDYEVGRALWTNTQAAAAEALGSEVVTEQEFWIAIGEQNFADVVAAQSRGLSGDKETRGLFLSTYGGGTTAYLQQAEPLGLTDEYAVIGQNGAYWETAIALGERAPYVENAYEYFWSCQSNEANDRFVADYEALAGTKPDTGAYQAYTSVMWYKQAIEMAGSIDPFAVQEAFDGMKLETLVGDTIDMNGVTHQATQPMTVAPLFGDADAPDKVGIESCAITHSRDL
jgi:branched-chain amino acid transport system substrate-binding protein